MSDKKNVPAAEVIDTLIEGNARFITGLRSVENFLAKLKMKKLATEGQFPFCTLITCSDSRIPIEQIFDRGMGDLFVIRTFGNVIDPSVVASAEYASLHFQNEIIVIMGHTRSGAVRTTLENELSDQLGLCPSLRSTTEKIRPALNRTRARLKDFQPVKRDPKDPASLERWEKHFQGTVQENIRGSARQLLELSRILQERVEKKNLFIVPALYEIDSGEVIFELPAALLSQIDPKVVTLKASKTAKAAEEILNRSVEASQETKSSGGTT
ncbi:MAG: hypothetical protein JNL01_15315 [Bdellovibrionales bacterium]|nr:hypothetical protein [Bdellovibrionales bacterium]